MFSKKNSNGFTLIELSIVIVIIGLIVAGVVGGQALVKQAKLRSIISEQNQAKIAINAFRLEYDAIPGDFDNAAAYWSTAADGCNANGTGAVNVGQCNGDGDGEIEVVNVGGAIEAYMAWKHLQLADLWSGNFAPSNATAVAAGDLNVKIPASKYTGLGITMVYDDTGNDITAGNGATGANIGRNANENVVLFGAVQSTGNGSVANGTILEAKDVQGIDDKVDDGAPATGAVVGVGTQGNGDADCLASATAYNLDSTVTPCGVAFEL